MSAEFRERADVLVVDNRTSNIGVAAAWNQGASLVLREERPWLVCLSAALEFELAGGVDFLDALERNLDAWVVEAGAGIGWHLIAFHRTTLQRVGLFDENFWPAYWEDLDYSHRIRIAGGAFWPKVDVAAIVTRIAHGVEEGGARPDADRLLRYYLAKWGGIGGNEAYEHPFNDPSKGLDWWPKGSDPRALTRLERA